MHHLHKTAVELTHSANEGERKYAEDAYECGRALLLELIQSAVSRATSANCKAYIYNFLLSPHLHRRKIKN